jgi:antitoxin VapB
MSGTDVYVKKFEGMVILFPKRDPWSILAKSLDKFSDDFMPERKQPPPQKRRILR